MNKINLGLHSIFLLPIENLCPYFAEFSALLPYGRGGPVFQSLHSCFDISVTPGFSWILIDIISGEIKFKMMKPVSYLNGEATISVLFSSYHVHF